MVKKILISSTNHDWGGSEVLWFQLFNKLASSNFDVTIVAHKNIYEKLKYHPQANVKYIKIPISKFRIIEKIKHSLRLNTLLNLVELKKYDFVLISQGGTYEIVNDTKFCEELIDKKINFSIISQFHEDNGALPDSNRIASVRLFQSAQFVYYTSMRNCKTSQSLIGNSNFTAKVIGNPLKLSIRLEPKVFSNNIIKFVCVGRLDVDIKAQNILISALANINKIFSKWELQIIGNGRHFSYLTDLILSLDLQEKIHLKGYTENIMEELDNSDVFILPSVSEGQSLALLEAASRGLIILATDVGGADEIINNEENGFIIPASNIDRIQDTIELVICRRKNWDRYSKNIIESIRKFTYTHNSVEIILEDIEASIAGMSYLSN